MFRMELCFILVSISCTILVSISGVRRASLPRIDVRESDAALDLVLHFLYWSTVILDVINVLEFD